MVFGCFIEVIDFFFNHLPFFCVVHNLNTHTSTPFCLFLLLLESNIKFKWVEQWWKRKKKSFSLLLLGGCWRFFSLSLTYSLSFIYSSLFVVLKEHTNYHVHGCRGYIGVVVCVKYRREIERENWGGDCNFFTAISFNFNFFYRKLFECYCNL